MHAAAVHDRHASGTDYAPAVLVAQPMLLASGLNWATFAAERPFEVEELSSAVVAGQPEDAFSKARRASDALVRSQLPVPSISATRADLQRALEGCALTDAGNALLLLQREAVFVATVWCLHPSTVYTAALRRSGEAANEEEGGCAGCGATTLELRTPAWSAALDLRSVAPYVLERGALVHHPEMTRCILAQGSEPFIFFLPPDVLEATSSLPYLHCLWYHGLFTLPDCIPLSPTQTIFFFLLPNSPARYTLDLTGAGATGAEAGPALSARNEESGAAGAPPDCNPSYPWRRQSKVRRVIKSGDYAVVVRDDRPGVMASLERAAGYHAVRKEATWLDPAFIRLMGDCLSSDSSGGDFPVAPAGAAAALLLGLDGEYAGKVRLLCIELVEKRTGTLLAGCCGMAIGRAYHDYTMYTLHLSKDSLGTFLTKLVGEALQRCGYALWYWGFRVEYMSEYEKHFGAVDMARDEFYRRWNAVRDVAPECAVDVYLRANRGMLPYYEEVG